MKAIVPVKRWPAAGGSSCHSGRAGANAVFAAEEFFQASLNNPHTRRAMPAPSPASSPGASGEALNYAKLLRASPANI